jgi:gliding motility-associated-like protein
MSISLKNNHLHKISGRLRKVKNARCKTNFAFGWGKRKSMPATLQINNIFGPLNNYKTMRMRTSITLLFSLMSAFLLAQAPANDDCAGLIDLGEVPFCSNPGQYTNVNATASNIDPVNNIPACFNNGGTDRDVWFQFSLPADGSIVDVSISVFGNVNGNGTLQMPQVAIYRGDCVFGGLAELDCAAAPLNVNQLQLDQFGLTPGIPYFLRINDYSATATPNAGTFRLCVEKYVPEINMGDVLSTQSCSGTLWDSGGPDDDYDSNEDLTFTICPQEFHQCIVINVQNYALEQGFDYLSFIQGNDISDIEVTQITGDGSNFEVQIPAPCATIRFESDGSAVDDGFQITWTCSPNACTTPPLTTCAAPQVIQNVPFVADGLSNCFSGNSIADGPCDDDETFLEGNDYIFAYTSPGDECVRIAATSNAFSAGIGVYDACPSAPGANCVISAGGGFGSGNPSINAAFLENPGTYYFVFGSGQDCASFDFVVDTVTCPIVLPPASTCDQALNIGGCSNILPQTIALNPGSGDPGFIQNGVNQGCFVNPQQNFSFFYFVAGADGKFGFAVEANNPDEASDIDFNVWGPISSFEEICEHVSNNQPVRSSWAGGADLTGLADIHPELGTPVTDDYDCGSPATPGAGGDDFVRRLDVLAGEIYVIMLDDFGNAIVNDGISINFDVTTDGVLNAGPDAVSVSADTSICAGQPVQLNAVGGEVYIWSPDVDISCINCPNPIVSPSETITYQVQIATACDVLTRNVDVKILELALGPDAVVCTGATFEINENPAQGATFSWTGPGLSCNNCPTPTISGLQQPGVYTYIGVLTTPQCVKTDTLLVTVLPGTQPQYNIANDEILCTGTTVNLGGAAIPGTTYAWTSVPTGFSSTAANPAATPTETITYFLTATNGNCPVPAVDSVVYTVYPTLVLATQADTVICQGQSVLLGSTEPEADVEYIWSPDDGSLSDINVANPLATPTVTTSYMLVASNPGCVETREVTISVVPISLALNTQDSLRICKNTSIPIQALVAPAGTPVSWSPLSGLQISADGSSVVATPEETITYTATVSVPGCVRTESVYIAVDSLPQNLGILPADTTVCQGSLVILTSPLYEPAEFPDIEFEWSPAAGQLTPDSLFNMVVQPNDTITYRRMTTNGACIETDTALVNVIQPPPLTVSPNPANLCAGQSVQLNLTVPPGVEDIEWMPADGLSCSQCNNPVATPTNTTNYMVQGTFDGCPTSVIAVVNVSTPPAIQFPADASLCAGESITLNLAPPSLNDSYQWTSTDPNFGTVTTAQPTTTPTQTTTYTVTATNGGCSQTRTLTVQVAIGTLSTDGDTTICANFPAPLSASGNLPGSYLWSTGATQQAIVVTPASSTTYTVTYTYGDNCILSDEVVVTVQGTGPQITFPTDLQLCPGESATLNSTVTPGASYTWTGTPGGFSSNAGAPTVTPGQTTTYNVTATLDNCTISQSVTMIVFSGVTLTVSPDETICVGESITLTANGSATGTYLWTPGGTSPSITVSPTANTTYDLLFTYGDGCTLEDMVTVSVVPNFSVGIEAEPDTNRIYVGTPMTLTAIVSPTQSLSGFQFNWLENGTQAGTGETFNVTPSIQDSMVFSYVVVATSPNGCVQSDTVRILVLPPVVVIPNAFTPGNDENNNTFGLVLLGGEVTVENMDIFNRWGERVFNSQAPNARWDGRIDGKDAPSDVYVYVIRWRRSDGALEVAHGDVTLLR